MSMTDPNNSCHNCQHAAITPCAQTGCLLGRAAVCLLIGAPRYLRQFWEPKVSDKGDRVQITGSPLVPAIPIEVSEGKKFDSGKLRYDLLPVDALYEVVKVLTYGAQKYDDNNWKKVEDKLRRYTAAAMRHGEAYRAGEQRDEESKLHHLAHRICCDLFLLQTDLENHEAD
jgi:hypothetical protein